ncbi:hypothetical protein ACQ4LE_003095 [Meloidogyne hapla]
MSPPAIQGQPKIRHDEQTNSVFLEVSVLGAEATKTKWYLEEKEIASGTGAYRMSTQEQEGGKKLLICEIKNYDKSMQGTYKAVFFSPDAKENYATFTVKSGSIQTGDGENCHHSGTNFELCKSLDPERLKNAPEFYEKPKITQKDGGKVIQIKIRVKSHIEMKAEWFKDDSPLKTDNRVKLSTEKDSSEPDGTILLLEINDPTKEDQAKYKCIVKNGEGRNEQSLNLVFD